MSNIHKVLAIILCTLFLAILFANYNVFAMKKMFFVENGLNDFFVLADNSAQNSEDSADPGCTDNFNRLGYGITQDSVDINNGIIDDLRVGFYLDWRVNSVPTHPNCAEYIQMIRLKQHVNCNEDIWDPDTCSFVEPYSHDVIPSINAIAAAAESRPGSIWLVGNEIDRYGQDYMHPEYYAHCWRRPAHCFAPRISHQNLGHLPEQVWTRDACGCLEHSCIHHAREERNSRWRWFATRFG